MITEKSCTFNNGSLSSHSVHLDMHETGAVPKDTTRSPCVTRGNRKRTRHNPLLQVHMAHTSSVCKDGVLRELVLGQALFSRSDRWNPPAKVPGGRAAVSARDDRRGVPRRSRATERGGRTGTGGGAGEEVHLGILQGKKQPPCSQGNRCTV